MGSAFGAIWEDPEGGFIKFTVKRASKQDQTLHMEGKLHIILYFRAVCIAFDRVISNTIFLPFFRDLFRTFSIPAAWGDRRYTWHYFHQMQYLVVSFSQDLQTRKLSCPRSCIGSSSDRIIGLSQWIYQDEHFRVDLFALQSVWRDQPTRNLWL